ncbi:hypothetical protein DFA_09126 [Cavenderia fasciculata]|uniref:Monalysin Pore-forming domain-containing protein n=1 Tax=Cavenderia fasciculata TaxID=261658 RepID=F4Q6R9_CACFS|nr:uncharacterized protein DFA_09126 [Cavenderia fasciculata]EGG16579.1 hypothetical protein DFA_09126 [Cavenderia fasciculata]|eukprot:XP_004354979.1 hypothetical protein DFA_09126 [Cavenderia fasciculata]
MKPIAIFNKYLEYVKTDKPTKHTVNYSKGNWPHARWDPYFFLRCEEAYPVKHHFVYDKYFIPEETVVHTTVDLGVGTFAIFQTVMIYGLRVIRNGKDQSFYQIPLFRNDVFATSTKNVAYEPVQLADLEKYLGGKGSSRWQE